MAHPKLMTAHARYDFSVDGGAISTIVPSNSAIIPDNAVIVRCYSVVTTAMTKKTYACFREETTKLPSDA